MGEGARLRILANGALLAAAMCLAAGLVLPILELRRFWMFDDGYSVLSLVGTLSASGEWLLAGIVATFAVVFPVVKLAVLSAVVARAPEIPGHSRTVDALDMVGKWSMLDVLVVALLIVAVKVTGVQRAATQPGLYLFVAAVLLSNVATVLVRRILHRAG